MSRPINQFPNARDGRAVAYLACMPPYFQFVVPLTYNPSVKHCFNYYFQQFSFANGNFVNNTGEGNGAIIYIVVPEFWHHYDANSHNVISACTFNNNKALTSLIYVSINASDAVTL